MNTTNVCLPKYFNFIKINIDEMCLKTFILPVKQTHEIIICKREQEHTI